MGWNERTNYIKENNIELGDEFIFTGPQFGKEVYKLMLFDNEIYYYTERNNLTVLNEHPYPLSFHMSSEYAESCRKFDREEEIDKLLYE